MKTLYIECKMGIAGDMLTAALISLFDNPQEKVKELNALGIPGVEYVLEDAVRCGVKGKHMKVLVHGEEETVEYEAEDSHAHDHTHEHENHAHDHEHENACAHDKEHNHDHSHNHAHDDYSHAHHHHSMYDIEDIIEKLSLSKEIKSDMREIYQLLAQAESEVHGVPVSEIHFHEVGNLDAIADIAAVCVLVHDIDADKVIVSPINVGGGTVKCAHGILPVPAPATALLLNGIPSYESDTIKTELCTPTGAALAKYFAFDFSTQPVMTIQKTGYGMGKKEFAQGNFVRVLYGETSEDIEKEQIVELSCNIDDMTAEEIGYATERLFNAGAVEVYTIAVNMKKNRPGVLLKCMCRMDERENMLKEIFRNTTTLGVRENVSGRYTLSRKINKIETPYGEVRIKESFGYDVKRQKLEYDDIAGIARRTGRAIMDIKKEIEGMTE